MAGSEAEERIRVKAVAALRRLYPDARIIHELVLEQGGIRLDVAAVTPDQLIVVEIKSERDVLKRLTDQINRSREVAQGVWVVVAPKHVPAVEKRLSSYVQREVYGPPSRWSVEGIVTRALAAGKEVSSSARIWSNGQTSAPNPAYEPALLNCRLLTEGEDGESLTPIRRSYSERPYPRPSEMLKMLWADELRTVLGNHRLAVHRTTPRNAAMLTAVEHMTGGEIRRAVCAALRTRPFARADEPENRPAAPVVTRSSQLQLGV